MSVGTRDDASMGLAMFLAALLLAAPLAALADVYKWTDERGVIVLSNVLPEDATVVSNVEVVAKEKRTAPRKAEAAVEYRTPTNEQVLQDRIESLERQLRAQQHARETAPPPVQYPQGYYTTPLPPSYDYSDSYSPPYPGYAYPSYHASPYVTFLPPVTTVFLRPRGHFHGKHFSNGFSRGTFPRSFAHGGFGRSTGTFRGRR